MSEPAVARTVEAVLLAGLPSLDAPVVPVTVDDPVVVGVPETVHVILAPAANAAGGVGAHDVVRPGGRPVTAHDAFGAANAGAPAFEHVNEPV